MSQATQQQNKDGSARGRASEILAFFTSVRTTVTLLFLLAAASVVGTVVPQDVNLEQIRQASPLYHRLMVILDLHNVYRSWWFLVLLGMLAVNLMACLIRRVPSLASDWKGQSDRSSFTFSATGPASVEQVRTALASRLGRLMGREPERSDAADCTTIQWTRDRFQLFGFPLIHTGIVVILLGGLMGLLVGMKGTLRIKEGESASAFRLSPTGELRNLPFTVAVDKFTLDRYPTGEPKEYRSDVRILKDGTEVGRGPIIVNHPLTFEGISFYQSDYRVVSVKDIRIEVSLDGGSPTTVTLGPHAPASIPETGRKLSLIALDPGSTRKGPAVDLRVEWESNKPKTIRIYQIDPEPVEAAGLLLRFIDFTPVYVTGLQVGYDPGSRVVWIGCTMLVLGFLLALFTNHRSLRVNVRVQDGKSLIQVSGRSKRARREFRETVDRTVREALEEIR